MFDVRVHSTPTADAGVEMLVACGVCWRDHITVLAVGDSLRKALEADGWVNSFQRANDLRCPQCVRGACACVVCQPAKPLKEAPDEQT